MTFQTDAALSPSAPAAANGGAERHLVTRARHDVRRRTLTVTAVEAITPKMLRISFASPELADFQSLGPDDHVKLFLPHDGVGSPCMRDYTPRAFDRTACTLVIEFALHEAGPATAWAMGAKVGDRLEIGGPRGSTIVPDDFDWYLLIADETGLPAVGRRLAELRPGVPVVSIVAVDDAGETQPDLPTQTAWTACWAFRDQEPAMSDAERLRRILDRIGTPPGEGFVWIAAEASTARALKTHFLEERRHPPRWLKASGYWLKGAAGAHEKLED